MSLPSQRVVVSGLGVTSAIGQGQGAFSEALFSGRSNFGLMRREGRQVPDDERSDAPKFIGAEIPDLEVSKWLSPSNIRTASLSSQVMVATLAEAWFDADLSEISPDRIGLVVGGSNFQQREMELFRRKYSGRSHFLRPSYAYNFMDTDAVGLCTQAFGIRGFGYTIGGASASGLVSIIRAVQAVKHGEIDVCIAIGAMMDLSFWECQGFRSLGAMGSDIFANQPQQACRPFDKARNGFIFGESCGAIVLENQQATGRKKKRYCDVVGWGLSMDANRNPDPSLEGEKSVINKALVMANWAANQVDYVNPHGSGSLVGDEVELAAIRASDLMSASINTTKSIVGHGLTSAGSVEVIATILQMRHEILHPSLNLNDPIDPNFNWVYQMKPSPIHRALKLSMGFGGVNSAICLENL